MSDWREKIEGGNTFISLGNGPFTGRFNGAEFVNTKFGDALQLKFTDSEGNDKILNTKSVRLQNIMKGIPDGTLVKLIRTGEGYDTFYEVEVVKATSQDRVSQTIEEIGRRNGPKPDEEAVKIAKQFNADPSGWE